MPFAAKNSGTLWPFAIFCTTVSWAKIIPFKNSLIRGVVTNNSRYSSCTVRVSGRPYFLSLRRIDFFDSSIAKIPLWSAVSALAISRKLSSCLREVFNLLYNLSILRVRLILAFSIFIFANLNARFTFQPDESAAKIVPAAME